VLSSDELMAVFQQKAQAAVDKATPEYLELRVPLSMPSTDVRSIRAVQHW